MYNDRFYSCGEHVEDVIEDWINKFRDFPNIEIINDKKEDFICRYCNKDVKYIVSRI